MMWIIASVPFWILGVISLSAAAVAVPLRRPGETERDLMRQVVAGLLLAGVFFAVAARIAT